MRIVVFIFCVLLLAGCASTGDIVSSRKVAPKEEVDTLSPQDGASARTTRRAMDEIFESGVKNYLIGNYKLAIENLYKTMENVDADGDFPAGSAYYLGRIYAELATNPDGALEKYQLYLKSFMDDDIDLALNFENPFEEYSNCADSAGKYLRYAAGWEQSVMRYKKTYFNYLLNTANDTVLADSVAKAILSMEKTEDNYIQVIQLCKTKEEQLQQYLKMEKDFGSSYETNKRIFQLYKESGDMKKALEALERLAKSDKSISDAEKNFNKIFYARQLLDNGKTKDAYNIAKSVLQNSPEDESAVTFMVYYYRMTGNDNAMYETIKSAMRSPAISNYGKYDILNEMLEGYRADKEDKDVVLSHRAEMLDVLRIVLSEQTINNDILMLCEKLTEDESELSETTEQIFYDILMRDPENVRLRELLINYYIEENDSAKCIQLCEDGMRYMDPVSIFYYYEGLCYLRLQHYDEMFEALDKGIKLTDEKDEADVLSRLYNLYGMGCYRVDPPNAPENYEKSLKYDTANIDCMKNYCNYLIDYWDGSRGDRLLELSKRAVELDPYDMETKTYYAMAMMLTGQKEAAKVQIDAVLSEDGENSVYDIVLEYAGDIYNSVGLIQEAKDFWKRAEAVTDDDSMKARINKKIEEN